MILHGGKLDHRKVFVFYIAFYCSQPGTVKMAWATLTENGFGEVLHLVYIHTSSSFLTALRIITRTRCITTPMSYTFMHSCWGIFRMINNIKLLFNFRVFLNWKPIRFVGIVNINSKISQCLFSRLNKFLMQCFYSWWHTSNRNCRNFHNIFALVLLNLLQHSMTISDLEVFNKNYIENYYFKSAWNIQNKKQIGNRNSTAENVFIFEWDSSTKTFYLNQNQKYLGINRHQFINQ